jgi:hypothetical protein
MKIFKLAIAAALAFAGAGQLRAQQTNQVQNLNIQLFGFSQGGSNQFGTMIETNATFVRVGNQQVIQALGAATSNSFSIASKLVVVSPLDGGNLSVQVRDGSNAPVDVSGFFSFQAVSDSVNGSVFNTKTGHGASVGYEIARFALGDDGDVPLNLHLDVRGFTTASSTWPPSNTRNFGVSANVSGVGEFNGQLEILQGSIAIFGRTVEVTSAGGVN